MKIIKLLTFLLLTISCSAQKKLDKFTIEDGVTVEKKDSTKQYDEVYNANNEIYNVITNNFTVSSVFIPDAAGIPVSYKLYRNTTIVPINIPLLSVKYI